MAGQGDPEAGSFPQYGSIAQGRDPPEPYDQLADDANRVAGFAADTADDFGEAAKRPGTFVDRASDALHAAGDNALWAGGVVAAPFLPSGKPLFLRARRRRLSLMPVALCFVLPFTLFAIIFAVESFSIRFKQPLLCFAIDACGLVFVAIAGCAAGKAKRWDSQHEPNWLTFLFLTSLVAWVLAVVCGEANYNATTSKFLTVQSLSTYHDIDPARMRGQQLMDAGIIGFSNNSRLDTEKSMGFRNSEMYCVAPVTSGDEALAQYDFWMVGKGCCTPRSGTFRCEGFGDARISGGLRLTSDNERSYYRLAVQQAEAKFGIKAVHPLFFTWTRDPDAAAAQFATDNGKYFLIGLFTFFVFHAFETVVAAMAFARIGHY